MMLCKSNINMQLNYFHANFIDVVVKGDAPSHDWRLTGMYGEPVWRNKHRTWKRIRDLHAKGNLPWVVIGDLNEILYSSEKEGGNARPMSYMTAFRECLSDCLLEDLGYIGNKFTWKRGGTRERLDRAVGNEGWSSKFPDAGVHHLAMGGSDHRPILIDTATYTIPSVGGGRRRRRFEGKWLREDAVGDMVAAAWEHSPPNTPIMAKLEAVHNELHEWDRNVLKAPHKKIKDLTRELDRILAGPTDEQSTRREHEITVNWKLRWNKKKCIT